MGVSKNRGTPKSSILIGCSIINHPFWGTTIFGNTHIIKGPELSTLRKLHAVCSVPIRVVLRYVLASPNYPKQRNLQ